MVSGDLQDDRHHVPVGSEFNAGCSGRVGEKPLLPSYSLIEIKQSLIYSENQILKIVQEEQNAVESEQRGLHVGGQIWRSLSE